MMRKTSTFFPTAHGFALCAVMVSMIPVRGQSGDIPSDFAFSVEIVTRSEDKIASKPEAHTFTFFDSVELLADTLIFNGFTDAPVPGFAFPAEGSGLYYQVSDSTDPAIPLANTGNPLPGVTTSGLPLQFGWVPNGAWDVSESGFLAYNALAAGTGGPSSGGRATLFSQEAFEGAPRLITNFEGQDPRVDNGSITISNLTTGQDIGGFFNPAVFNTNLGVTAFDQVILAGDFGGGVPNGGSGQISAVKRGAYIYPVNNEWAAILRVGDPAPGIGTEVTSVSMDTSKRSSDVLLSTGLKDGTTAFWRFDSLDDSLKLLGRNSDPAPGFPGRDWAAQTALLGFDNQVIFQGTATQEGHAAIEAFWVETEDNGITKLEPAIRAAEDGSETTQTTRDPVTFRTLSTPLPGPNNNLYFFATAHDNANALVSGLWKFNLENKTADLLLATNTEAPGQTIETGTMTFQSFEMRDVNAFGHLLFSATLFRNGITAGSLWLLDNEGELFFIAREGTQLGGETDSVQLNEFFFNRYAGALEARSAVLSDTGTVAFLGEIPDGDDEGTIPDSAIFRAVPTLAPGEKYFWSGEAGSDLWYDQSGATTNWRDDKNSNWNKPPGTEGNEVVAIDPAASVMLNTAPAAIGWLNAKGSLAVNQSLTIRRNGEIENLNLSSNLIADGVVGLNGNQNIWHSGEITGQERVEVDSNGLLTITPSAPDAAVLKTVLEVSGQVVQENGNLILSTDTLNQVGEITINTGGSYELLNGAITDTTNGGSLITNLGAFQKKGGGTGEVSVPYNGSFSLIDVQGGTLKLTGDTRVVHEGTFATVAEDSVLEFGGADSSDQIITLSGKPIARGAGTLRLLDDVTIDIRTGTTVFGLTGFSGEGLEVEKAYIFGEGGLAIGDEQNPSSRATFLDATFNNLKGGLTNHGVLDLGRKNKPSTTALVLDKTQLINNAVATQYGDIEVTSTGDGFVAFDNRGTYTVAGENRIFTNHPVDGFYFNNASDGRLEKIGKGKSRISADFDNQGSIHVSQGTLALAGFNKFKSGSVITLGATESTGTLELGELGFDFTSDIEADLTISGLKAGFQGPSDTLIINSGLTLADGANLKLNGLQTNWNGGIIKGGSLSIVEVARNSIFRILGSNAAMESLELTLENESKLIIDPGSNTSIHKLNIKSGMEVSTEIEVKSDGKLTIEGAGDEDGLRISPLGTSKIVGAGTFQAKQTGIDIGKFSTLGLQTRTILFEDVKINSSEPVIHRGLIFLGETENSPVQRMITLKKMEFNNVAVTNFTDSNDSGLTLEGNILFNGGMFLNSNEDEFEPVGLTLSHATLLSTGDFAFFNNGEIIIQGDSLIEESITFKGLRNGSVRVKPDSIGRIGAGFSISGTGKSPFVSINDLLTGSWIVETNGRLVLNNDAHIYKISSARVELRGSGILNNLPNVTGDFSILEPGALTLSESATFNVSASLSNEGGILLDNAVANVSDTFDNRGQVYLKNGGLIKAQSFKGKRGSFLRGKDGSIDGSVENEGTVAPGESEIDTSDPVVVPASIPGDGGSVSPLSIQPETRKEPSFGTFMANDSSRVPTHGNLKIKQANDENALGVITINGDYTQTETGILELDLGGTSPEESDQLVVNGTATLGGTLRLRSNDETFPVDGTNFAPVSATAITGQFDNIIYGMPSGRQVFDVVISETGITASTATLNVSTFADWRAGVFSTEDQADERISGLLADPDEDGLANLLEYALDGNPKIVTHPKVNSLFEYDQTGKVQSVTLDFPRANGMTDVRFSLQYSTDLDAWNPLTSQEGFTELPGLVSLLSLKADLPAAIGPRVYVRLVVSEI